MSTQDSKPSDFWLYLAALLVVGSFVASIVSELPSFPDDDRKQRNARINVRCQLQTIRAQMELYNVQNPDDPYTTDGAPEGFGGPGLVKFWDALVQGDYIQTEPINPLTRKPSVNDASRVAAAPAVGGAWLWMESSPGDAWTFNSDPETGQPY
jgi:hypothetical protein